MVYVSCVYIVPDILFLFVHLTLGIIVYMDVVSVAWAGRRNLDRYRQLP